MVANSQEHGEGGLERGEERRKREGRKEGKGEKEKKKEHHKVILFLSKAGGIIILKNCTWS